MQSSKVVVGCAKQGILLKCILEARVTVTVSEACDLKAAETGISS